MQPWQILVALGLLLAITEFFTPTFFSLPAGLAFFATGLVALFVDDWKILLLILGLNLGVVYWVFHSYVWPRLVETTAKTNADAMGGKIATVSEAVDPVAGTGYVKLYGDSWGVISKQSYPVGARVMIVGTTGNKVRIRALEPDEDA